MFLDVCFDLLNTKSFAHVTSRTVDFKTYFKLDPIFIISKSFEIYVKITPYEID